MVSMVNKSQLQQFILKLLPRRLWVQVAFLLVWLDPLAMRMHTMCSPVFHCYACPLATFACPIGVIAQFSALHMFPFIAIGLLFIVAGTLGSIICGWVCPFGLLQDLAAKVPIRRLKIPRPMATPCLSVASARQAFLKKRCQTWRPQRFRGILSLGRMRLNFRLSVFFW
jgi:polyferredoxin